MELTERDIYRTSSTPLTSLLHRSCYTAACCTVLVTHLKVVSLADWQSLKTMTQNGLLEDTISTCPIVVSHQADVHLQVVVLTEAESFHGWMDAYSD